MRERTGRRPPPEEQRSPSARDGGRPTRAEQRRQAEVETPPAATQSLQPASGADGIWQQADDARMANRPNAGEFYQRFADTYPLDERAPSALWHVGNTHRQFGDHASAAQAFFAAYRAHPGSIMGRNSLAGLITSLELLGRTAAWCAAAQEFLDVYPRGERTNYGEKLTTNGCGPRSPGAAVEGMDARGVTARYDPAAFTFQRSIAPVLPIDPDYQRAASDAELLALPRPTQAQPVYYDIGGSGLRAAHVYYRLGPCHGPQAEGHLMIEDPARPSSGPLAASGKLCNGRPYQFSASASYEQLARELAAGRYKDGYGGSIPAAQLVQVRLSSFADFERLKGMAAQPATIGPVGSPASYDIASMLAVAFNEAHDNASMLLQSGYLRQPSFRNGGYLVVFDRDGSADTMRLLGQGEMMTEQYTFFVDDDQPPQCKAQGQGYVCGFRYRIDTDVSSFMLNMAEQVAEGGQYAAAARRQIRARNEAVRTDHPWQTATIPLEKTEQGWRSDAATAAMRTLVERTTAMRAASGAGSSPSPGYDNRMEDLARDWQQVGQMNDPAYKGSFDWTGD